MGDAMNAPLSRNAFDNDTPQRLAVVAAQFGLTAAALRTEAKRGRLVLWRVAGKDWTSVAEVNRMFQNCRVTPEAHTYGSGPLAQRGDPALWIIRDAGHQRSTGFGQSDRREAETALAEYIAEKYAPARRERDIAEIPVADVLNVYLADVAPGQARPEKAAERCGQLLEFFGERRLNEVTGATCRAYAEKRGSNGGSRRDLQDLAAAIGHHSREGLAPRTRARRAAAKRAGAPAMAHARRSRPALVDKSGATARIKTGSRQTSARCAIWSVFS